jgi:mono/diheme cytochrome c family protein
MTRSVLMGVVLMLLACSSCSRQRTDPALRRALRSPAARRAGRALFVEHCVLCHGVDANGQGVRREGVGQPQDFTSSTWRESVTPEQVLNVITHGKRGTSMPSWVALSVDDRRDLAVYVLSVSQEGP